MKLVCRIRPAKYSRKEDTKLNIFAPNMADNQPQSVVVCTRYPITQRLIDEYIRNDQDVLRYKTTVLEQADFYQFDQVFGAKVQQQSVYNHICASRVSECVNGTSSTFWCLGAHQSGKTYTLRGGDHEDRGIVCLAVEDILNLFEMQKQSQQKQFKLTCSILAANDNEMVDLVGSLRSQSSKQTPIKYLTDFKNIWRQAMFQLKNYSRELPENITNSTIIQLFIQQDKNSISQINFISQTDSGKSDPIPLRQFILAMQKIQRDGDHSKVEFPNRTTEAIYLLLNQSRFQNITLIAHISAIQSQFMDSYRTLQFFDDLRLSLKTKPTERSFGSELSNLRTSINNKIERVLDEQSYNHNIPLKENQTQQQFAFVDQSKQFMEIKELLKEKEKLEAQNKNKARKKKALLKEEIKTLKLKTMHLEETMQQKDHLVAQLENRLQEVKLQVDQGHEMFLTAKQKEGFYEKNQEELREMVAQLNQQLLDGERELSMVRQRLLVSEQDHDSMRSKEIEYVKHYETREDEFLSMLRAERQRAQDLQHELDYFAKEAQYRDENSRKLEESLSTLNRIIDDQQRRIHDETALSAQLQEQLKTAKEQASEAQKLLAAVESKYGKLKTKLEADIQQLKEDKLKYLKKYKAKLHQLKPTIKTQEEQANLLKLENMKIKSDYDSVQNELDRFALINAQLNESYQKRSEEVYCNTFNHQVAMQSSQLQQAIEHLEKLTGQYEQIQGDYEKLQYMYENKENELKNVQQMLEKVCDVGHSQMDDLDSKISKLNLQLQQTTADKQMLIKENSILKLDLQQSENNEQILEKQLKKLHKERKILRAQLGDMNTNLKEIIVEKNSELRSNSKMQSQNMSYRSIRNKMDHLLSSNSKRDFLLVEEDSMSDL